MHSLSHKLINLKRLALDSKKRLVLDVTIDNETVVAGYINEVGQDYVELEYADGPEDDDTLCIIPFSSIRDIDYSWSEADDAEPEDE